MQDYTINNTFCVSVPEGFREMTPDEYPRDFSNDKHTDCLGWWDKERHIIISVLWHQSSGFIVKLAGDAANVAKSTEQKIRHSLKHNDYRFGKFFSLTLCGHEAEGFTYDYTVPGTAQTGEVVVLLHDKVCYTFYYYARKEGAPDDNLLFGQVLESLKLV